MQDTSVLTRTQWFLDRAHPEKMFARVFTLVVTMVTLVVALTVLF